MKRTLTLILTLVIFAALAVSAAAAVVTPAEGYTAYPLINNENVKFYTVEGDKEIKVTKLENAALFGPKGYELQIWWQAPSHLAEFKFGNDTISQGVAAHGEMYTEITFTGTAIRLGTHYRNIAADLGTSSAAKVTVDGKELPMVKDALVTTTEHNTTPTIFFEATGLKDIEHKVRIYNAETKFVGTRVNFDWYEIIPGTGKDAGGNPATSDAVLAASLVIVAAAAAVVFTMKKR